MRPGANGAGGRHECLIGAEPRGASWRSVEAAARCRGGRPPHGAEAAGSRPARVPGPGRGRARAPGVRIRSFVRGLEPIARRFLVGTHRGIGDGAWQLRCSVATMACLRRGMAASSPVGSGDHARFRGLHIRCGGTSACVALSAASELRGAPFHVERNGREEAARAVTLSARMGRTPNRHRRATLHGARSLRRARCGAG
jgi:hypothetical protein